MRYLREQMYKRPCASRKIARRAESFGHRLRRRAYERTAGEVGREGDRYRQQSCSSQDSTGEERGLAIDYRNMALWRKDELSMCFARGGHAHVADPRVF